MKLPPHVEQHPGGFRFKPSPRLVKLGFSRRNLVNDAGNPMTPTEVVRWYETSLAPEIERRAARDGATVATLPKPAEKEGAAVRSAFRALAGPLTVESAFEWYWREESFTELAPKTRKNRMTCAKWLSRFDPDLWQSQLASIDRTVAFGLYKAMRRKSPSMAHAVISIMRRLWSTCQNDGLVRSTENPFSKMWMKSPAPRVRVWSPEELAAIMDAADQHDPEMGDAIMLAHETGQRQGDVLKLHWGQVDDEGRFTIKQGKTGTWVRIRPTPELSARLKLAKSRCDGVAAEFEASRAWRREGRKVEPTIVLSRHTGTPIQGHGCSVRFAALREIALKSVPSCATLTFQDLRDTAITNLADAGATPPQIASITGHTLNSVHLVLRHYLAATTAQADAAIDLLGAYRIKRETKAA